MSLSAYELGRQFAQQQRNRQAAEEEAIERGYIQPEGAEQEQPRHGTFQAALGTVLGGADKTVNIFNEDSVLSQVLDLGNKWVTRPVVGAGLQANQAVFDRIPGNESELLDRYRKNVVERVPGPQEGIAGAGNPMNWLFALPTMGQTNPLGRSLANIALSSQDPEKRKELDQTTSFTDYFNKATQGEGFGKFAIETVLDPLNLAGFAPRVAKGAQAARDLGQIGRARNLDAVAGALRFSDEVQGAPLTIPIRGLGQLNRIPQVRRAFEKTGETLANESNKVFRRAFQRMEERGIDPFRVLRDGTNLDVVNTQQQISLLNEAATSEDPAALRRMVSDIRSGELGRILEDMPLDTNRTTSVLEEEADLATKVRSAVQAELVERPGVMKNVSRELTRDDGTTAIIQQPVPTERLKRHIELSRFADQSEWSAGERDIAHRVLDASAIALKETNPQFRHVEDVFSTFRIQRIKDQGSEGVIRGAFAGDEERGFTIGLSSDANVTTLPHEALGHLFRRGAGELDQEAIRAALNLQPGDTLDRFSEEEFADIVESLLFRGGTLADNVLLDDLDRYAEYTQYDYFRGGVPGQADPEIDRRMGARVDGQSPDPLQQRGTPQTVMPGVQGPLRDPQSLTDSVPRTPMQSVPNVLPGSARLQDQGRGLFRQLDTRPEVAEAATESVDSARQSRYGIPGEGFGGRASSESIKEVAFLEQLDIDNQRVLLRDEETYPTERLIDLFRAAGRPLDLGPDTAPTNITPWPAYTPGRVRKQDIRDFAEDPGEPIVSMDDIIPEFRRGENFEPRSLEGVTRAGTRPQGASRSGRGGTFRALEEELGRRLGSEEADRVLSREAFPRQVDPDEELVTQLLSQSEIRTNNYGNFRRAFSARLRGLNDRQLDRMANRVTNETVDRRIRVITEEVEKEFARRYGRTAGRERMGRVALENRNSFDAGPDVLFQGDGDPLDALFDDFDSFMLDPSIPADQVNLRRAVSSAVGEGGDLPETFAQRWYRSLSGEQQQSYLDTAARFLDEMGVEKNPLGEYWDEATSSFRNLEELVQDETFARTAGLDEDVFFQRLRDDGLSAPEQPEMRSVGTTRPAALFTGSSVKQVIDRISVEAGASLEMSDRVRRSLQPVIDRNPEQFDTLELWNNRTIRRHIEAAMQDPANFDEHMRVTVEAMRDFWSAVSMKHPGFGKFIEPFRKLSSQRPRQASRASGRTRGPSALRDEERESLRQGAITDPVRNVVELHDRMLDQVNAVIPEIRGAQEIRSTTSFGDVLRARQLGNDRQKEVIDRYLDTFDINAKKLSDEEIAQLTEKQVGDGFKEQVFDAHRRAVMEEFGVKLDTEPPRGLLDLAKTLMKAWREQALISPRYHLANAMDMSVKSAIEGENPVIGQGVDVQMQRWGRELPVGVDVDPFFGRPEFNAGLLEDETAIGQIPLLGRIYDAGGTFTVGGRELPRSLVKLNQQFARAIENSFRRSGFVDGTRRHLNDILPRFHEDLLQSAMRAGVDEGVADEMLMALKTQGVDLNRDQLLRGVVERGGTDQMARAVANIWDRYLDEAMDRGLEQANRVHFDFDDTRNIEEWLGLNNLFGFHFWMTRNVPYYIQTFAQNPWLMRFWDAYNDASEAELEESGLSRLNRIRGMVPLGGDPLLSALFGDAMVWFNPMVAMSVTEHTRPRYQENTDNPLGQAINTLERFGAAPAPWITIPLQEFTDVLGENEESGDILRHTGLLREFTGFDPESYTTRPLIDFTRTNVFNRPERVSETSTQYKDYLLSRRISELAIEEGQGPDDPAYIDAQTNPESVIYQRALRDVEEYLRVRQLTGFLLPIPYSTVSPGEQQVRAAQSQLPEGIPPWLAVEHGLIGSNDPAAGFLNVNADPRRRQINAGFDATEYLMPGIFGNAVRQQAAQQYPAFGSYLSWLRQQPEGSGATIDDFLNSQ